MTHNYAMVDTREVEHLGIVVHKFMVRAVVQRMVAYDVCTGACSSTNSGTYGTGNYGSTSDATFEGESRLVCAVIPIGTWYIAR